MVISNKNYIKYDRIITSDIFGKMTQMTLNRTTYEGVQR